MSQLRIGEYVMPAARLGPASPLVPFVLDTIQFVSPRTAGKGVSEEEVRHIGYGYVEGCLPYFVQDDYDRLRRPRVFRAAVLENEFLRATFLLDLGGRLWSLLHKPTQRELLHANPVFQPANLAIRNAWFSGGVEWNFCWLGHTPLTCSPLFAARAELDDGTPVLRLWEWERARQMPYQIDAFLPEGSQVLFVRVRLANRDDRTVPVYWWSNIAVPERPDARVLAPTDFAYAVGKDQVGLMPYPYRDGVDRSYPTNSQHGGDCFFRIPPGEYPWVASVGGDGRGFFHSSTSRLIGRKMWVFGQGPGGRRWQDFLNTPGHPYIELQGGLGRTQFECLPMPPRTEWEWLEAYGPLETDAAVVHGRDWPAAWHAVEGHVVAAIPRQRLESQLQATGAMARREPREILHRASGWGALELRRRRRAGQDDFAAPPLVFPDDTLSDEQAPWLELLENGRFPQPPAREPPKSWMIQQEWRQMLEESVSAGRSDHWAAWLHLGIMYLAEKRHADAQKAWERSVALGPSAWAYRNLGALAASRGQPAEAARFYLRAAELAPGFARLAIECARALLEARQDRQWLDLTDRLEPEVRRMGRIRLLEAQAALAVDELDRAGRLLGEDLELTDVREGDGHPAELWFTYHEKRLAAAEGIPIDDDLRRRVRRDFPPPPNLEYRLH